MELNLKDVESGWTALHRAFFYGQIHCARILIEVGLCIVKFLSLTVLMIESN